MSAGPNAAGPFYRRLFIPEANLERICSEALASVDLLPETPGPVRIERFIYLHFSIEEEYEAMPDHIMGCAKFTRQGLRRIIVNRQLAEQDDPVSKVRVRSTLAHEAGHGLFHAGLFVEKLSLEAEGHLFGNAAAFNSVTGEGFVCRAEADIERVPHFEWWEYQANSAMAALLLPKHLIIQAARARLPMVLAGAGSFDSRVREAEREIAAVFNVSRRMVSIRLGKWWVEQAHQPSLF
ncbi:MAG: ImmA/IrrE family metallo-endopeptidase [Verrucomicrobia bacterium]|nr:ImmA/IrrE family metallo-endopeptidase [Verrucomicrobiota bacterium]